ncbi:helix-turn-helix transcriptional regulator [Mesorhizobium sp.]|uniref:AraC family transcriptional regulator n=1 Tax=Mesorhizobium sp. TaxID=1871066 RepID=UPI0025DF927A|nr:helix-turn-helix transcriptional regulator [Mesorhizobium sp.]
MQESLPAASSKNRLPAGVANSAGPIAMNVHTLNLRTAEDLREAVRGADLKIVQLSPGTFEGRLMHAQIGDLSLSTGDFGPDIRARGLMNQDMVTIGMMLESSGAVSQWDYDVVPGDVIVFPKSVEQEGRFTGHSRYATITLGEEAFAAHAAGEPALQDPAFWTKIHRFRPSPQVRALACRGIAEKISQLEKGAVPVSEAGVRYFQRSLVEGFIAGIVDEASNEHGETHTNGAKLVRDVEDYIDGVEADRPVHISELCSALTVSRRSLHRAFQHSLGTGPVAYLRLRRLAAVHRTLSTIPTAQISVTQAALDFGFTDLGRFAAFYRKIFGEFPSHTLTKASSISR